MNAPTQHQWPVGLASPRDQEAHLMGKHGDGKDGEEGDKNQSKKESDGQWTKPVTNPPKK
ncbi:hypothetical protein GCM10010319_25850 [Streptomyces blastmyceticus]|uniref:Uncharacterized protein n=1 Tax=Streptomyces blastmyceticus TaxID=68180 RepID=A0ABP3GNU0_9ACTN